MVKGGRTREAAALAWERQGATPDKTSFKNWAKSVLDNPAVVEAKVKSNITEISSAPQDIQKDKLQKLMLHFCMCVCPGACHRRFGSGDSMCCHKEETSEEGPAAVPGGV